MIESKSILKGSMTRECNENYKLECPYMFGKTLFSKLDAFEEIYKYMTIERE